MAKILLVDDDAALARMTAKALSLDKHNVELAHSGQDGLDRVLGGSYDLLILDVGLPDVDGFEICRSYRANRGQSPVIMLTGKGEISDKELGFGAGADDYITKPFSVKELSLRVTAALRRPAQFKQELDVGPLKLDAKSHRIMKDGRVLNLSPIDYGLLEFFMRNPNQIFSTEALIARVWPTDQCATYDSLRSSVKRIRQQLDEPESENSLIETVKKVGYRLIVPVYD